MSVQLMQPTMPSPIEMDDDGVIRVGGTRVRLDTVVTAFNNGSTAEEIAIRYPSLALADVYAVVAYYLRNRDVLADYFQQRAELVNSTERELEANFPSAGVIDRLMARAKQTA